MKKPVTLLFSLCLVFALIGPAQAALTFVSQRTSLGGNDFVDWGTLGAAVQTVSNPFAVVSNLGLSMNVSIPQAGYSFRRVDQWSGIEPFTGWDGNFAIGDKAIWTGYDPSPLAYHNGPMTIVFASPILGAGAQIQANEPWTFVATIEAYDPGNNSLGSFQVNGSYNTNRDNSAIFFGIKSDSANIAKLVFNVTQVTPAPFKGDLSFALNRLDLIDTGLSPANPSIANGATNVSILPQFAWQAVNGAIAYDLYLWKEGGTKPTAPTIKDIPIAMATLPGHLAPMTSYRWQVIARRASGQAAGPEWTFTTGNILVGDVDGDNAVNLLDAIIALQAISGLNPTSIRADYTLSGADANGDGKIGLAEAIYILQYAAELRGDTKSPTVSSTGPANNATEVAISNAITATFSEVVDTSTLTTSSFTLKQGSTSVPGFVSYSGTTATFTPSSALFYGVPYTATITTGVRDLAGNVLANNYTWTFTTGAISTVTEGNVTIGYMGNYYKVAIDLTGGTTRLQTGVNYARAMKRIEPQIEVILDSYLSEMVEYNNYILSYVINLANQIKASAPTDIRDEALGVTSVFNSTIDSVNDGALSANEFWVLQLMPELGTASCSAVSVFGSSSATGKTIVGRNLDWSRGSSYQLSKLHAVTVIKKGARSLVSIGFLGLIGCLTCFNDEAVFAAVLQSNTGGSYSAAGKRSYLLDGRYALENYTTLADVANYLKTQSYAVNHLWFLSDANESKVLENCIDADCHARGLRSYNSTLNTGVSWGIDNAIGAVNSFVLNGNKDNHTGASANTQRWSSQISQTNGYLSSGNTVSTEEMKEIISYHSGISPGSPSAGDLYWSNNIQTIVFQPTTFTTDIAFPPVGALPNKPSFRTIFSNSPF